MAVTIEDLLNLESMRDFKIVAGKKGLGRSITATEILDFEFIHEGEEYRERGFDGDSLVLTSLLFAKDDPGQILKAVKKLISQNVQALAYKPVFFKELPKEAIAYADEMKFPILEFGHDEYFEDIIFSIRTQVEKDGNLLKTEPLFQEMLSRNFTQEESCEALEKINPLLRPQGVAVCLRIEGLDEGQITGLIRRSCPDDKLRSKVFVGKCENRIFIILSQDEDHKSRLRAQFDDVMIAYGFAGKNFTAGFSTVNRISHHLDKMIRQAYWAEKVAEIEKKTVKFYSELGIYKLIVPNLHTGSMQEYMEEYLGPLFEEEGSDGEFLHTAVSYVMTGGDILKTAEQLYCHKNTIRYRIGKLQEKLDPDSSEKEFWQNLAAAVKIYLLMKDTEEEKK